MASDMCCAAARVSALWLYLLRAPYRSFFTCCPVTFTVLVVMPNNVTIFSEGSTDC